MFKPSPMLLAEVSLEGRHVEGVMRELGRLEVAHMLDSGQASLSQQDKARLDRCSLLQERIQSLLGFIRWQGESPPAYGSRIKLLIDFDRSFFNRLPSDERLAYLEERVAALETVLPMPADQVKELLCRDVVFILDEAALELFERENVRMKWFGSSSILYTAGGFVDSEGFKALREKVAAVAGEEYVLWHRFVPKADGGRVLAFVAVLKEKAGELGRFIGFVPSARFPSLGRYSSIIQTFKDLVDCEMKLLQQAKDSFGSLAPLSDASGSYAFAAWVPKRRAAEFTKNVASISKNTASVRFREPKPDDNVPILLDNALFVKPFETILEMFSLPAYGELDPTPLMAITILMFFGLMFGDVGHGILATLLGLLVCFTKGGRNMSIGFIVFACGISSIIAGFMYGSFFGMQGVVEPLLAKPEINGDFILVFLILGMVHMSLGLLLGIVSRMFMRPSGRGLIMRLVSSIKPAAHLIIFLALVSLLLSLRFGVSHPLLFPAYVLAFLLPILMLGFEDVISAHVVDKRSHGDGAQESSGHLSDELLIGAMEVLHTLTSVLSNTLSYTRIFILALVHEITSEVVLRMSTMALGIPAVGLMAGSLIFAIGTLVILAEGVLMFIQDIRLHYHEFFSKFYQGGGLKFEPFSLSNRKPTLFSLLVSFLVGR
jgi:hypothetical protein